MSTRFIHKMKKAYSYYIMPKKHLTKDTIVINPNSWILFDANLFKNEQYSIITAHLEEIDPKDYTHIVAYIGVCAKDKISQLKNMKWLQIASHGYNGFDQMNLYRNSDIIVTSVKDVFSRPIAQYCITAFYFANCYAFRKMANSDIQLKGKYRIVSDIKVMIYGLGNIGLELAKLCKQQGWNVCGVKRHIPEEKPEYVDEVLRPADCESYISEADYIVNLMPENESSIGYFDYDFFTRMKKSAVFCNVGRGSAVVDDDLERAVSEGFVCVGG